MDNVGADDMHTKPGYTLLQTLRERSIHVRAECLQSPDLADDEHIRQPAGNYDATCVGCHLSPAMAATELSEALYPAPPNLSTTPVVLMMIATQNVHQHADSSTHMHETVPPATEMSGHDNHHH